MPSHRSLQIDLSRAAAACAALLAMPLAVPAAERGELLFLSMLLAAPLLGAAWLAPRPGLEFGIAATLAVTAAWSLPASPTRSSLLVVIGTLALLIAAARRLRQRPWTLGEWGVLLIALQALCRGDHLLQPGFVPGSRLRLLAIFVLFPALAAVAGWILAALGRGWGIAATAAAVLFQGGLHVANTVALILVAGSVYALRSRLPRFSRGTIPATAAAVLAAFVVPVASYPWLAPRPLGAVLALPLEARRAAGAQELLVGDDLVLTAEAPSWGAPLAEPPREIVVVSNLANAAGLAAGAAIAAVEVDSANGEMRRWTLRNGYETGEWAARRPDVRAPAPRAWHSLVAGDFFAQRYRARWHPEPPPGAAHLRVVRDPGLPATVQVAIFSLEVRR